MAKFGAARSDPSRRRSVWLGVLVVVVLALGVSLPHWYWLPQDEATRRARDYMALTHAGLAYESVTVWKRWNGRWAVEFGAEPPVRIEVDREGMCEEH